ncbi:MAG: TlpA family protein disulfide reductase [Deltaproteobacteria bacterium]|nr:TlpA family protein disulfide reductase [Deltaproteobacteria bacterium]
MLKKYCISFLNSCFILPRKLVEVDSKESSLVPCIIMFLVTLLLGAYTFDFIRTTELFMKFGASVGLSEIVFIIKSMLIKDFIPVLIIFAALIKVKKLSISEKIEVAMSSWLSAMLIRTFLEAVPRLFTKIAFYPLPFVEIPQLVAYGQGLISLSVLLNYYYGKGKRKIEDKKENSTFGIIWAVVVVVAFIAVVWVPSIKMMPYFIKAPSFVIPSDPDKDGKPTNCVLEDYRGKTVLLEFWRTTCPHCRKQAAELEKVKKEFGDKVAFLSIHTSGGISVARRARNIIKDPGIKLCYDNGSVSRKYSELPQYHRLRGVPHMLIIDSHGIIRGVIRGYKTSDFIKHELSKVVGR